MLEALCEWMGFPAYFAGYGGSKPKRSGASHAAIAPYGPFECKDKEMVFLGIQNEREWGCFCERVANREDLHREIEAIYGTLFRGGHLEYFQAPRFGDHPPATGSS